MFEAPPALSRMAFGVAGPHATPMVAKNDTITLVEAAYEGGITAFDTGPSYGAGAAEARLGEALAPLDRNSVFISTKAGINEAKARDFSVDGIRFSLDRSLKRLGCDYVDTVFLHGPGAADLSDPLLQALEYEKDCGRVRALGVAGRGTEIDAALALGVFDLLMAPVNATIGEAALVRLRNARSVGIGVFGIEVLSGASAGLRWPGSAADLWYSARAIAQRKWNAPSHDPVHALQNAVCGSLADITMISTTRVKHLQEALRVLDEAPQNT